MLYSTTCPPPPLDSPPHVLDATSIDRTSMSDPPPSISPPHLSEPVSTFNPPPLPLPPLVSPSIDHCISRIPHVSSSTDPPLPALPPHVSQDFDALDTMNTSGIVDAHLHDIDIEAFDSALMPTFVYEIVVLDRDSTYGSKDTDAPGSSGGPS
jgi:hypothetical protein